ncbi:hypothetical protein [Deinococcus yavapaiensis]|uniref:Uncharacterized protein n=1 Tax=Deinococcus yavapaiensis KR-236 TaxID=694435 RepID=A0A318S6F5_9DEIO|nr:hypothetical protein [Deinococcus yavapaiensis]PYE53793.1 hypothetical protein DES52_10751 [Deinococcus yavapaiensis KR-236]
MTRPLEGQLLSPSGRVYVLRVWYDPEASAPRWRASLQEGGHGEKKHFASIDDCVEFLYGVLLRR